MRYLSSVAVVALVLAAPAVAYAQEPTPAQIRAAAEAFDRGREAYEAEQYRDAAEQFERADSNAPSNAALEYALRSRDQAGNGDRAAKWNDRLHWPASSTAKSSVNDLPSNSSGLRPKTSPMIGEI